MLLRTCNACLLPGQTTTLEHCQNVERGTLKVLIELNLTIRALPRNLHWFCKKVLSATEDFWVIPGQREVYHAARRRDRFQPTTDDVSRYFGRRTTAAKAGRIWIDGSHHQAYAFASLL